MVEIIKSASDRKLYRYIEFENGLKVVLIQDPEIVPNQEDAGAGGLPRNPKAALGEDFEDVEQLVSDDEGASSDSQSVSVWNGKTREVSAAGLPPWQDTRKYSTERP